MSCSCVGCYRSPEGDYWCPKFGGWRIACPLTERDRTEESDGDDED